MSIKRTLYSKKILLEILIYFLVISALASAEFNLIEKDSIGVVSSINEAAFHPIDNDLLALANSNANSGTSSNIYLYNLSANTFNLIQNETFSTIEYFRGLKFSPVNGTRAVASINEQFISILTLTPEAIYFECSSEFTSSLFSLDISPSGNEAAIASGTRLVLYEINQTSIFEISETAVINGSTSCYGTAFINETLVLLGCSAAGVFQYIIQPSTIIEQTLLTFASDDFFGMTFMQGSNTTGIYTNFESSFYNFSYIYDGSSSIMNSSLLVSFSSANTYSATFSADNTRIVLTANNNITLYLNCLFENCATCNSSGYCLTCTPGYFSPDLNCSYECNRTCLTCSNSLTCDSCILSSPPRILSQFCACPNTTFDDGFSSQCESCLENCEICTNETECINCIGSTSQNSSRLLPNCSCPAVGYFDAYPNYTECESCPQQCINCSNKISCSSCAGNITWNFSRVTPECSCPANSYSDLSLQIDCIVCPELCATCDNATYCTSCIGIVSASNSRLQNEYCSCPAKFYSNLSVSSDCLPCTAECASCTNYTYCTSCVGTENESFSRLAQIQCACPDTYFSNLTLNEDCLPCPVECLTCTNSSFCTSCIESFANGNLQLTNLANCECPSFLISTSLESETQTYCLSTCCAASCYSNSYFNTSQESCLLCDASCLTCSLSSTNCTSCNTANNFILTNFECVCKPGFILTSSNNYCTAITETTSFTSNIPVILIEIDQSDEFPIFNITFPVSIKEESYADFIAQNLQVEIAQLTVEQNYFYNITAQNTNYITINFYFMESIGEVNILIYFPNALIPDIYNRAIPLANISYLFGPYLILQSGTEQEELKNIENSANAVINNEFTEVLRAVSFVSYVLVSIEMTFNLLLINTVYPQNFYEILRLFCATYIRTIPPYNQLNTEYDYAIIYIPVNSKLQTSVPSLQFYRLGFNGQELLDSSHELLELIILWFVFTFIVKKIFLKYEKEIEMGEKKYIASVYIFIFETIVKVHESIFGIVFCSLLLQFECVTFLNSLGIICFFVSLIVSAYIIVINIKTWSIISNKNIEISWICEYFEPLVAREGLINQPINSKNYYLIKYFELFSYIKKSLVIILIFLGSKSGNFELIEALLVYTINLVLVIYINPYRSIIYTIVKILTELLMIILLIIILVTTNKLESLMEETILNTDDVNYVNSLGWAAAGILSAFNVFCLIIFLLDYVFDLLDFLEKRKQAQSSNKPQITNHEKTLEETPILEQSEDLEMVEVRHKIHNLTDIQSEQESEIIENINNTYYNSISTNNYRDYNTNLENVNDPKNISILSNAVEEEKSEKQNVNQSHKILVTYNKCINIESFNEFLFEKKYLEEVHSQFEDHLENNTLSKKTINQQLLKQIDALKIKESEIEDYIFCINDEINSNLYIEVDQFISRLEEIIFQEDLEPQEIVSKWIELTHENEQAAELLYFEEEQPTFQDLLQYYGFELLVEYKKQMEDIEEHLNSFQIGESVEERIDEGENLCELCEALLNEIKIALLYLLITNENEQDQEIFFETFEALDPFYQQNNYFPVRLARRVENELFYLSQKNESFKDIFLFISKNIDNNEVEYENHGDKLLNLDDIIEEAIQIFINKDYEKNNNAAEVMENRLLSIKVNNNIREAVTEIRNEIATIEKIY